MGPETPELEGLTQGRSTGRAALSSRCSCKRGKGPRLTEALLSSEHRPKRLAGPLHPPQDKLCPRSNIGKASTSVISDELCSDGLARAPVLGPPTSGPTMIMEIWSRGDKGDRSWTLASVLEAAGRWPRRPAVGIISLVWPGGGPATTMLRSCDSFQPCAQGPPSSS
ncbi:hypothetical protein TREES_T100021721 [Tupaia chinensis]|uniref:Uncharacterized protein n=1 Tax=Tupaia chinensis TaxID=246437 RepID=L9JKA2_TUPCH|nr:hypothetical protein TREES_T100021721 [Tupaia chinensis]